ncbi:MAG TPA: AAA family ATPase [Thermoanaerobaculia bacterium]|nr:AAA family ATPase [Thermoanaerobaculia bacterium]
MGARGGAIQDDVLSAVKDAATSVRVAELLGVALKREGGHFKGRCPLPDHPKEQSGKTPPFTVYGGERGGWKCFSCGKGGGDGIALYRAVRGTDFQETIRALGLSLGISIELPGNGARPRATAQRPVAAAPRNARKAQEAPNVARQQRQKAGGPPPAWTPCREPRPGELDRADLGGAPAMTWDLRDLDGNLIAAHPRWNRADKPKELRFWRETYTRPLAAMGGSANVPLYLTETLPGSDPAAPLILVEGEKCADLLREALPPYPAVVVLATACGCGATPTAQALGVLAGRTGPVVTWPDNDGETARQHMQRIRQALAEQLPGLDVRTFDPEGMPAKGDAEQWIDARRDSSPGERLGEIRAGAVAGSVGSGELVDGPRDPAGDGDGGGDADAAGEDFQDPTMTMGELARKVIPVREDVVTGLAKVGDAVCISGQPGRGKSLIALRFAACIAAGQDFSPRFRVPKARPVLYIDGELLEAEVKERAVKLAAGAGVRGRACDGLPLRLLVEMACPEEAPKLNAPAGRLRIERLLDLHPEIEVLFLDSLRVLFSLADENKSEAWAPVNDFLFAMKRRGLETFAVHHNSRADTFNGHLSGTTAFAQIVNLTERQEDEDDPDTMAVDVTFSKARSLTGAEKRPFGLALGEEPDGALYFYEIEASPKKRKGGKGGAPKSPKRDRCNELNAAGWSYSQIIAETGVSKSSLQRWYGVEKGGVPKTVLNTVTGTGTGSAVPVPITSRRGIGTGTAVHSPEPLHGPRGPQGVLSTPPDEEKGKTAGGGWEEGARGPAGIAGDAERAIV